MISTNDISGFINTTTNIGWLHHTYLQCAQRLAALGNAVPFMEFLPGVNISLQPQQQQPQPNVPHVRTVEESLDPTVRVVSLLESALGDVEAEYTSRKAVTHEQPQDTTVTTTPTAPGDHPNPTQPDESYQI